MLYSKKWASTLPSSLRMTFQNSSGNFVLCGGVMPSDADMTSLTTTSTAITSAALVTISVSGTTLMLMDTSAQPPVWEMNTPPTNRSAAAVAAGTITWAAISLSYGLFLVDVSLPNQGGVIQVDKTTVSVGTVVSIMGMTWSFWR